MRGWSLVVTAMLTLLAITPIIQAVESIGEPSYTNGDEFVYVGHTAALLNDLNEQWKDEEGFEGVTIDEVEEFTVTQRGSESCNILDWSGDCTKAIIEHTVNMTVSWENGSTNYDNDSLQMSVIYEATHWKSRGTPGWEKLDSSTKTTTIFSGGGEDNLLEHELNVVQLTKRVGDFPATVRVGEAWDVEERSESTGVERNRENRGVWTEAQFNYSEVTQVSYKVIGEGVILYGIANEKTHDVLSVERVDLGNNVTTIDHFVESGYLAKTETWQNGTLTLSATLTEHRYYVNEPHDVSTSSNWIIPTMLICLLFVGLIAAGAGYAAVNTAAKTRVETHEEP